MPKGKIRVLVVDDSAFMRKFLGDIICGDSELELAGTARDGEDALAKREYIKPDVMTMDIDMPKLDGLSTLRRLMEKAPIPVIMVSSHTKKGSETTLEALSAGAVDFIGKPSALMQGEGVEEIRAILPQKIKAAAGARLFPRREPLKADFLKPDPQRGLSAKPAGISVPETRPPAAGKNFHFLTSGYVVLIGASTGGPRSLEDVFSSFPANFPAAVLVTQHMPPQFTDSFAKRLDRVSGLKVLEARGGEKISPGCAYVAPGGYHLIVEKGVTSLSQAPPVQYVRPSADVMMDSAAQFYKKKTIGVILTGMGRDGTDGMAEIKKYGGRTIVQDPSTAVIASMPQTVISHGLADEVVPLTEIAGAVMRLL